MDLLKLSIEIQQWRDKINSLSTERIRLLRIAAHHDRVLWLHAQGVEANALLLAARRDRSHFMMMPDHAVQFLADKMFDERQSDYRGPPYDPFIEKVPR